MEKSFTMPSAMVLLFLLAMMRPDFSQGTWLHPNAINNGHICASRLDFSQQGAGSSFSPRRTRRAQPMRLRGGGVPKFWRWLSERYPLINKDVKGEPSVPGLDNFYLDMNGIIHPCTHGNVEGIVELTEAEMFTKIFSFLDSLVQLVKPQKLLFLAIDGVAPRAKMNQQRARRFRAAQQLQDQITKVKKKGEVVPTTPFDSNCITPGTEFMQRLTEHLRYFISKKIDEDGLWRTPQIIFSGHDVPGEGEHKIMEHIRRHKMQPEYDPNIRHCVYGNDADLVMLALATHEPHFTLLRYSVLCFAALYIA